MAVVPPDAAAARPPPRAEQEWRQRRGLPPHRPAPLDPELEAWLRRQRALEYGRGVRHSLAAWHERYSAKRQEQLAAQRELWEAERASRLARLAEMQQQVQHQQQQQRGPTPAARPVPSLAAAGVVAADDVTPAALLRAVQQLDTKLSGLAVPGGKLDPAAGRHPHGQQEQQKQPQAVAKSQLGSACGSQQGSSPGRAAMPSPLCAAGRWEEDGRAPPTAPADLLTDLLMQLLATEVPGDPFSIVNLFIEEQLQLQWAASAASGACTRPGPNQASRGTKAARKSASGSPQRMRQPPEAPPVAGAGHQLAHDLQGGHWHAGAAPDAENVPANVRHRRTGSMLLPDFEAAAASEQPVHSHAGGGHTAEEDAAAPSSWLPAQQPPASQQAVNEEVPSVGSNPPPPVQQQASSKQLYVHQWLQASVSEFEAPGSPQASTAAYSADPDHRATELDTPPSMPSSAVNIVQPKPLEADSAADAGSMPGQPPVQVRAAAVVIATEPALVLAAAAVAAPAGETPAAASASLSSASRSIVTSLRRPGAPLPPGSSSQPLDGSTTLSGSVDFSLLEPAGGRVGAQAVAKQIQQEEVEEQAAGDAVQPLHFSAGESAASSSLAEEEPAEAAPREACPPLAAARSASSSSGSSEGASPGNVAAEVMLPLMAADKDARVAEGVGGPTSAVDWDPETSEQHSGRCESDPAYSTDSDFDSQVEISYGEQYEQYGSEHVSPQAGAAASSPRTFVPQQQHELAHRQQPQRPRSPLHALDDMYPGNPPSLPGHLLVGGSSLQRLRSSPSRPLSPASQPSSRRVTGDGSSSRPGSPAAAFTAGQAAAHAASTAEACALPALQQESSVLPNSPSSSTLNGVDSGQDGSSISSSAAGGSPYAVLRFSTEPDGGSALRDITTSEAADTGSPRGTAMPCAAVARSPPGTPVAVSPADMNAGSCPGSARVEDATVVQTEEHVRSYLGEVLGYFWEERAEAFASGQAPPLELEGYLAIERRRPACGDPQHIFNKLLFDAVNEALAAHYAQALDSYTGRLAPRLALLSREMVEQNVVQRVVRWGALGGGGGGRGGGGEADLGAILAEDAAEEERLLAQLAGTMQTELAVAGAAAQPASPWSGEMGAGAEEQGASDSMPT